MSLIQRSHATEFVMVLVLGAMSAPSAHATVLLLGIGNDGYYRDVLGIQAAIQGAPNPHGTLIHVRTLANRSGSSILRDIGWLADNARPGDAAYFYYSGHGGNTGSWSYDEWAGQAANDYDEMIGLQGSVDWCTDDQLADALGAIDPAVPVIALFDTCHAGGMIGGTDDLNSLPNVYVMMSSQESQNSYGGYPYSRFTSQLVAGLGDSLPADTNGDDDVTLDEWFGYAVTRVYGQNPISFDAGGYGTTSIIPVPEPTAITLLVLGAASLIKRGRR